MQENIRTINERTKLYQQILAQLTVPAKGVTIKIPPAMSTAAPPAVTTVAELERQVDKDADLRDVMSSILELMREQQLSTTRGAFFAVVVSMAVIVAGVSALFAAKDWSERWWMIVISLGIGALAAAVYLAVRWWQQRTDTPDTHTGS